MRGFWGGFVWGGVAAVALAAVVTMVTARPPVPQVPDGAPVPAGRVAPLPDSGAAMPTVQGQVKAAPAVPGPQPIAQPADDLAALSGDATRPTAPATMPGVRARPLVGQGDAPDEAVEPPPRDRFATRFDAPADQPLLALVLTGGGPLPADWVGPVTHAIAPTTDGAAARMQAVRAAGGEVLALFDLPRAATARDAEVALAAVFAALPEALGLVEGAGTGLRGNRELARQVIAFAEDTGRVLVLRRSPPGAGTHGTGVAPVAHVLDTTATPAGIRRALDRAAFRARQTGAVVLLLDLTPAASEALRGWVAEGVTLAPVSAVIRRLAQP
ncbi:divergent polysaccharide deacetylase family protein [Pukyongiella litopenaei]|uniref:Divergent polysaccharide deacetylase family protein n=1 Tax=Pukyongiella litopenaei TaxID=2605946 RepID=A0A2S0MTQ6_9RHOB|nr:divergent polysaccharide deacetylase family protein [Pukyongiella litopenaei]AVO39258.1 hypothetical protein C6Y53_17115 [Pukyongiella litopenaei]